MNPAARVVITTVQRLYSVLRGEDELPVEAEEGSLFDSPLGLAPLSQDSGKKHGKRVI